MTRFVLPFLLALWPAAVGAMPPGIAFRSIDGSEIRLDAHRGGPILVVNTASLCAFTPQLDGLQALWDRYRARGLTVVAVPSDSFRQELGSEAEVAAFCETNYALTLPIAEITPVRGANAHPFYAWLREAEGFAPRWNFDKVLIAPDGTVAGTWRATTRPDALARPIEALLSR